jgi:uncharacterized phage protein (TIGR01671 family)
MSREIKFRAWNGETMHYPIMVGKFGAFWINAGKNNDGLDENDKASLTPFNTKCSETTKLMQFSGVHDGNGKLMYEGDVVKGGSRTMQIVFKQEACQFWLIWKDSEGVNRYEPLTATYRDDADYFSNDSLQVIGNIYENPELLSGQS